MKKKLLLVDASNLLFRSYYATAYTGNLMQTSDGKFTNGIYGFVRAMKTLLERGYTHVIVALDSLGKTHRHQIYEDYKGTRQDTPPELIEQFAYMEDYLKAAGVYFYRQESFEADDVIGYAVKHFKDDFDEIMIYSNDQDLMQLIDDHVFQLISKKGLSEIEIYDKKALDEKLGLSPQQIPDFKGLVGDSSDNIPGIKGVGKKTAEKLLKEYHSLENIIEHIDDLKGKLKERIEEGKDLAVFSKELATIKCDFDNQMNIKDSEYKGYKEEALANFYRQMSFRSFLNEINKDKKVEIYEYKSISGQELEQVKLGDGYLHLELYEDNYHSSDKIGFSLISNNQTYYIDYDQALKSKNFTNWLKDEDKKKYVYDLKKIKVALLWDGFDLRGVDFDLLLGAYLINPNIYQDDFSQVVRSLDHDDVLSDDLIYGRGAKKTMPEKERLIKHMITKVKAIKALHQQVKEKIQENQQVVLFNEIEIPLANTLAMMEFEGINIDQEQLISLGKDLDKQLHRLESEIYALAGEDFNINSPKQLSEILFEKLDLPAKKKTKSGYSTDISVLNKLKNIHPIINLIIDYRTYSKLKSTYIEGLLAALQLKDDQKIHTIYQQALTKTGRLSSKEPNLQNLPIKTEIGRELRKVFVGEKDHVLLSLDYSQIELRVVAELANVKNLKLAFKEDKDIHLETAKKIFGKEEISANERSIAKAINFSIIYGKTTWGLSEELDISPKEAERFINAYFETYPEIKEYTDKQIEFAQKHGYVVTMFNRKTFIPEIGSKNYQTREFGKRIAMNAPIQGSAADILKAAMVKIDRLFKNEKVKSKIILQIHDEIVLDVFKDELDKVIEITKTTMENILDIESKLLVHYSYGQSLYEVK
ncbi:DNA polymerase I [Hujiaoplasma nucleasis]|uniref:DNA polymerase I n=1 Tax=Hujiaoplasma nucleasis TaxID=2725268 RepID=A0A7L6N4D4_9MOLU|nr:DNA polymerase I [Hujiaoplasma nucleasis]QLY39354.1 DNA polymerase I [Hujiaoplasma nucleasis]